MIEAEWIVTESDRQDLPPEFSTLPRLVQHLLKARGLSEAQQVQAFLAPKLRNLSDPFLIGEMQAATDLILQAVDEGWEITLFGDYDVDGITSVALMSTVLESYGVVPNSVIPLRGAEGYGLTDKAVDRCLQTYPETQLLITMDCGTSSITEVARLREAGLQVIILDHHEPNTDTRPPCNVLVNPKACFTPNTAGDFSYLCAAGVVFKVCHALLKVRRESSVELKDLLDLVAIATVADIVPLVEENRILVTHGLRALAKTTKPGLIELMKIAGVSETPEASDIGFRIGPRINAAGRMDCPLEALEVLLTDNPQQADRLVQRLNKYNIERQNHEKRIQLEAYQQIEDDQLQDDHCIIVGQQGWHPGVVGIVASRIMRRYFKPCFVIAFDANGMGKGSGRSINDISLVDSIDAGRQYLTAGGGHHAAAGIALAQEHFPAFRERVNTYLEAHTTAEQRAPKMHIDADVNFSELTFSFLDSYDRLKPFGSHNPQPVFMSRQVSLVQPAYELKNKHLKLTLAQGRDIREAIFFGGAEHPLPPEPWDICYTVDRNHFRGRVSLQITIKQIRTAQ